MSAAMTKQPWISITTLLLAIAWTADGRAAPEEKKEEEDEPAQNVGGNVDVDPKLPRAEAVRGARKDQV